MVVRAEVRKPRAARDAVAQGGAAAAQPLSAAGQRRGRDLRAELAIALASARLPQRRVILHLFAGSGGLCQALRRRGEAVLSLDLAYGAHHDLLCETVFGRVKGWITSGAVKAMFAGTPCEGWSRARRGTGAGGFPAALRDAQHLMGFDHLQGKDLEAVQRSNRLALRAHNLLETGYRLGLPGGEENPGYSFLWDLPSRRRREDWTNFAEYMVDQCAMGTPYRARTRIQLWRVPPQPKLLRLRCTGRGTCDFSLQPHQRLSGSDKGTFLTKQKSAYPALLCTLLAAALRDAAAASYTAGLWARFSPARARMRMG